MKDYTAVKMNKLQLCKTIQTKLRNVMLREKKTTVCDIFLQLKN